MNLTLLFDHRFYRDEQGVIFSLQNYNYSLFAERYLEVFDQVRVVARVASNPPRLRNNDFVVGAGLELISLGNWVGPFEFLRNRRTVLATIARALSEPTAVIMIAPGTVGVCGLKRLAAGRPYAVEVVGDPYDVFAPGAIRHPLRPVLRVWQPRQLRHQCAGACAAAYVTRHTLQRRYPPAADAFTTHYSSVALPPGAFVSKLRPPSVKGSRPYTIVHVGSFAQAYKAQHVLLDAVATCIHNGANLRLILVGEGQLRNEVEVRAKALGIRERVEFRGQLVAGAAVRAEFDQADLFVLPSLTEGLPRAMIEAMARGLPCIGSRVGGIPEVLAESDMVPPGDAVALAAKISAVLHDSERRMRMAARNLIVARGYRSEVLQARRRAFYSQVRERTTAWLTSGPTRIGR